MTPESIESIFYKISMLISNGHIVKYPEIPDTTEKFANLVMVTETANDYLQSIGWTEDDLFDFFNASGKNDIH